MIWNSPNSSVSPATSLSLTFDILIDHTSEHIWLTTQAIILYITLIILPFILFTLINTNINKPLHTTRTPFCFKNTEIRIKLWRLHAKKLRFSSGNGLAIANNSVYGIQICISRGIIRMVENYVNYFRISNRLILVRIRNRPFASRRERNYQEYKVLEENFTTTAQNILSKPQNRKHLLLIIKNKMANLYSFSEANKKPTIVGTSATNRPPRQKVNQTQLLNKSYESMIDKFHDISLLKNAEELALRAEKTYSSTLILIGGLPLDHTDWPSHRLNQWILHTAHQLQFNLGIVIDMDYLQQYIDLNDAGCTIFPDGDSCSFPLPIQNHTFQLGGGAADSDIPMGLGVHPGGQNELFYTYQALPTDSTNSLRDIRLAVELCTFRGIPGNLHEVSAVIALILHRADNHISKLCGLSPADFDVVLHRRSNTRYHHPKGKSAHEFVVTVYCRPQGKSIGPLRDKLQLKNAPSEANLDWIGEIWGSYYASRTNPPSMLLLHRTPHFCIYGFHAGTTTKEMIRALIADNPTFALALIAYFWVGPYKDGPIGLHMILTADTPSIIIGSHLSDLGAVRSDGDPKDNPSMVHTRENTAGDAAHHDITSRGETTSKGWTPTIKEKWLKMVTYTIAKMPTLVAGRALGFTHAGSDWADPTLYQTSSTRQTSTTIDTSSSSSSSSSLTDQEENSRLRSALRARDKDIEAKDSQIRMQSRRILSLEKRLRDQDEDSVTDSSDTIPPSSSRGMYGPPEDMKEFFNSLLNDRLADLMKEVPTNKRPASQISLDMRTNQSIGDLTEDTVSYPMDT